ncbi:hypothetical protein GGS26DRAFT_591560 [Hypomontagnella submonticulosa]|nr:hypothetical protein GGS26DRAFT_591560 [Hypomontagnella submonticulosa]
MTLVAFEVTSPETIVVAGPHRPSYPMRNIPLMVCDHQTTIHTRVGQKFDITVDIEGNEMQHYGEPTEYFDVNIEDGFTRPRTSQVSRMPINLIGLSVSRGGYWSLEGPSDNILALSRIKLEDLVINVAGHYHLFLVIHSTDPEFGEPLAQIRSKKISVHDRVRQKKEDVSAKRRHGRSRHKHSSKRR